MRIICSSPSRPGGEAVIQVDGVRQIPRARQGDHFDSLVDFVGYWFFPEHGDIGTEQLHRRFVMVAAVFLACRGYTGGIDCYVAVEHFLNVIEGLGTVRLGGRVGAFGDAIADNGDVGLLVLDVAAGVDVADATHSDNSDF